MGNIVMPALIPELTVSDLRRSLEFYCGVLGFEIAYDRPAETFAFLVREEAAIMLEECDRESWITGTLEAPFGRGMHLQIQVSDIGSLYARVCDEKERYRELEDAWYRRGDVWLGNRQFVVQDSDGYLLRFFQSLGQESDPTMHSGRVVG
ncbi:MAG: VOC family protein [Pseudomonadota bacterium]